LLASAQTAWDASHHQREWPLDSATFPHIGQFESFTILRMNNFSFLGKMSLHTRQRNNWTARGACNFQMVVHARFKAKLEEQLLCSLPRHSTGRWYALRTKKKDLLPFQSISTYQTVSEDKLLCFIWASQFQAEKSTQLIVRSTSFPFDQLAHLLLLPSLSYIYIHVFQNLRQTHKHISMSKHETIKHRDSSTPIYMCLKP
jgi:hypothetical protein